MRVCFAAVMVCCLISFAVAESPFTFKESEDKLTGKARRQLIVTAEDGKSTIELRQKDDSETLTIFIDPAGVIFPDHVGGGEMGVSVTMRSSAMKKPVTVRCDMNFMKYDFCYLVVPAATAKTLFSGEHVTMQLARTADTLTFPLGGDGFAEALEKVVAPAEKLAAERQVVATEKAKLREEEASRAAESQARKALLKQAREAGELACEKAIVSNRWVVARVAVSNVEKEAKRAASNSDFSSDEEAKAEFIKAFRDKFLARSGRR